jgi:serine/threonine protein kinase
LVRKLLTVDPRQRYTAAEVLTHPWITGGASSKPLAEGHTTRLMMLQARRRLRKGVQMIIAINKFGSTVEMLQREAQREVQAEEQARQARAGQATR